MIVIDSSFLCGWYNERDVHHVAARGVMDRLLAGDWGPGLLLDYVLAEVVTVLMARRGRESAFEATRRLLDARELEVVLGAEIFLPSVETFRAQPGRELSFTDAAVITLARRQETPRVATFDAGFQVLSDLVLVPQPDLVNEVPQQP